MNMNRILCWLFGHEVSIEDVSWDAIERAAVTEGSVVVCSRCRMLQDSSDFPLLVKIRIGRRSLRPSSGEKEGE